MKRGLFLLVTVLLLVCTLCGVHAEGSLTKVHCDELSFSTKIPADSTAEYVDGTGYQIYVEHAGYIPYVIIFPRSEEIKFSNPTYYLNNTYREYLENQHGNNMVGTNPAKKWSVGGKDLLGARYIYKVQGTTICLLRLIEQRDDGDVEYSAKYIDGDDAATMAALDAAVRYYAPDTQTAYPVIGDGPDALPPDNLTVSSVENVGSLPLDIPDDTLIVDGSSNADILLPIDISGITANTDNGTYQVQLADAEHINNGGYFTVRLFVQDHYPAKAVEALTSGDLVRVNGENFTVSEMIRHDTGVYELIPQESFDGYIVFNAASDGTYTALVNDWIPCTHLSDVKIMMPLPYQFSFAWIGGDDEATVYDADAFVDLMTNDDVQDLLNPYNTIILFNDGMIGTILHTDYPEGPEAE